MKRYVFVGDQVLLSLGTFLFFSVVSRGESASVVGWIAVIQSVGILATTASRAVGVDVWAARGAPHSERAPAAAVAPVFIIPGAVCALVSAVLLGLGVAPATLLFFSLATALMPVLDTQRIIQMHAGGSLISLAMFVCPVIWLSYCLLTNAGSNLAAGGYAVCIAAATVVILGVTRQWRLRPSMRYAIARKSTSVPFVSEVMLSAGAQQVLFFVTAASMSLEVAALLRLAQTTVGPLGTLYSSGSPLILRHLASLRSKRLVLSRAVLIGGVLASLGTAGVVTLVLLLNTAWRGRPGSQWIFGIEPNDLSVIVGLIGFSVALNGLTLALGNAARVLSATRLSNRLRVIALPFQAGVLLLAATQDSIPLLGISFVVSSGVVLASTAIACGRAPGLEIP